MNILKHVKPAPWPAVALAAVILAACGAAPAATGSALPGSAGSLEELGETALAALAAADTARLNSLRLSEYEHNELVWPKLPAARPEVHYPVDLAWDNIEMRNRAALRRLLARFRATPYTLAGTECRGETQRFDGFHVLTDCYMRLRTADGEVHEIQVFKDVLVMGGEYKIFRYYAD